MNDSGLGSFGSESTDSSPSSLQHNAHDVGACPVEQEQKPSQRCDTIIALSATYYGETILNRRHTPAMLPWVMAYARRRGLETGGERVKLVVSNGKMKVFRQGCQQESSVEAVLFEHDVQSMTRFVQLSSDHRFFSYLTRSQKELPFRLYVYMAEDVQEIQKWLDAVYHASSIHLNAMGNGDMNSLSIGHLYEVLYVGKVMVSAKKAPPTFIDDAVSKFEQFSRLQVAHVQSDVYNLGRERHESDGSVHSLPAELETIAFNDSKFGNQQSQSKTKADSQQFGDGSCQDGGRSSCSDDAFINDASPKVGGLDASDTEADIKCDSHESLYDESVSDFNGRTYLIGVEPTARRLSDKGSGMNLQRAAVLHQHDQQHITANKVLLPDHQNRTMLIQVGDKELMLISLDRKSVIFARQFKDISFCSQGITHPEHFGFISREPECGHFTCYVFRCAAESVVEELMLTLKQAFQSAFQQSSDKDHVICELCPMHQMHKLCQQLEKLNAKQINNSLQQCINQLNESDQTEIKSLISNAGNSLSNQEWNEVVMTSLLQMSEKKQCDHIHLGDVSRSACGKYDFILSELPSVKPSKFDDFCSLARKSISSSFEYLFKGRPSSESSRKDCSINEFDSVNSHLPELVSESFTVHRPVSAIEKLSAEHRQRRHSTPHHLLSSHLRSPLCEEGTKSVARMTSQSPSGEARSSIPQDSPMRAMFVKVGNNDPADGARPVADAAPSGRQKVGARSVSLSVNPPVQPGTVHRGSWRLGILSSVVADSGQTKNARPASSSLGSFGRQGTLPIKSPLSTERVRTLWKKAFLETVLLVRMNKENSVNGGKAALSSPHPCSGQVDSSTSGGDPHYAMVDYDEVTPCLKEVTKIWERLLNSSNRTATKFDVETLNSAVKDGVPKTMRGDIWQLLVEQYCLHHGSSDIAGDDGLDQGVDGSGSSAVQYQELLKRLTLHQHAILIDLGRTFPSHPYFSAQLGPGQLALFNLLKAYSLLDEEVGYCQGLSFVTGILLIHVGEQKAFDLMKHMMFRLGFRRQYRPDMVSLQIQMYQLSRLLHDFHKDLYDHFELNEIAPTLYAAPWFLTIFASQFPIGFVARVFDLIFLQGIEVVLKVSLALLANHKELIKQCIGFEAIVEFLKSTLPDMSIIQMERVINEVFAMNIAKQLEAYEVEYHVLQEEMNSLCAASKSGPGDITRSMGSNDIEGAPDRVIRLQIANDALRRQKIELLEQLQMARRQIHSLEEQNQAHLDNERKLNSHIRALELERTALLGAVAELRQSSVTG